MVHLRCGWNIMLLGLVVGSLSDRENCPHTQVCLRGPWIGSIFSFFFLLLVSHHMLGKRPQWERLRAQKQAKLIISFVMPPTLRFWLLQFHYPIHCHSSQHQSDRVSSWEFAPCIWSTDDKTLRLQRVLNKIANLTAQDKQVCMHKLKTWNTCFKKNLIPPPPQKKVDGATWSGQSWDLDEFALFPNRACWDRTDKAVCLSKDSSRSWDIVWGCQMNQKPSG